MSEQIETAKEKIYYDQRSLALSFCRRREYFDGES